MSALNLLSTFFLILFLCESWASTSVPDSVLSLVPHRHTQGVTLASEEDTYVLRIISSPNLADRFETVKEIAPGNLNVEGYYKEPFFDRPNSQPLVLEVNYEAGANGYKAKYSLVRKDYEIYLAAAPLLKTLAG